MDHAVRFVDQLPNGHKFMLVETADAVVAVFEREALCPAVMEEAWAAYRALEQRPMRLAV